MIKTKICSLGAEKKKGRVEEMKRMLKGAFVAAAMISLMAGVSAADKKAAAPAAKDSVYAITFNEMDTDKNGKVTLSEYTVYWAKPEAAKKVEGKNNTDKKAQEATFGKIDKNGDKSVVVDEYVAFYAPAAPAPAAKKDAKKAK
ncbi:MAG: hypothetical protein A2017_20825 [Lentisphaerae bacterium GWF2_44_16]|nr:MAG: hypothetical protein A2017_20825 [Lentisphaerae bacterium GWF2_44_16]